MMPLFETWIAEHNFVDRFSVLNEICLALVIPRNLNLNELRVLGNGKFVNIY